MEIGKAVVLASDCPDAPPWSTVGFAARQLAPVANRPVLFHQLDALAGAGVRQAAIVTDTTTRRSIVDALGDGSEWGLELTHLETATTGHVLASPELGAFVGREPVVVHHGDVMLSESWSVLTDDFAADDLDALIIRPRLSTANELARGCAGYIIRADIFPAVRRQSADLDDVLHDMRAAGARIGVRDVDACIPWRGGTEQLLEANRRMLENLTTGHGGERVFESKIQGIVDLHPSAEIRGSTVRGPVTIGPGARITDSYIGPYTSIGAGVVLDGIEIEHSVVLDHAQVRFLGTRVEDSLIGRGARVSREFRMPRALRLSVGEGAQVSFDA